MVKKGDKVLVDGKESIVTGSWGQGRHTMFSLADGRNVPDLTASHVVHTLDVHTKPLKRVQPHIDAGELERLPLANEDHEE